MPVDEESESAVNMSLLGLSGSLKSPTSRNGVGSRKKEESGVGWRDVGAELSLIWSVTRELALLFGRNVHLVLGVKYKPSLSPSS